MKIIIVRESQKFYNINNPVLNFFIDIAFSIIRGIASIIDGLVLIISFGRLFPALAFRAVIFTQKRVTTRIVERNNGYKSRSSIEKHS
tara:strand:+ start:1042 stop:1305 length:264 start_codon:yes stop_codon:yes gene_type:complete